jgi:hypothetical protein
MQNGVQHETGKRGDDSDHAADAAPVAPALAGASGSVGADVVEQRLAKSALELADAMNTRGSSAIEDFISICAWCPQLHVLRLDRKPGDSFFFSVGDDGKLEMVYRKRGGERVKQLTVSDGICESCRVKYFGEGRRQVRGRRVEDR